MNPKTPRIASARLALALASLASAPAAKAVLVAYEGFDISAVADITGTKGTTSTGFLASGTGSTWTLMSGSGDNVGDSIVSPGLTYTGLNTIGNQAQVVGDATGSTFFYRNLTANAISYAANSVTTTWASFLIQANNTAAAGQVAQIGFFSSANPTTTTTGGFTFGAIGGSGFYRASARPMDASGVAAVTSASSLGANNLAYVVLKFVNDTNASTNDFLTAWINPNLASFDGTEASLGTASIASASLGNVGISTLNSVAFGTSYTTAQTLKIDEIYLGTALADVVAIPEPSAFGMFAGLGVLGCCAARRRRAA